MNKESLEDFQEGLAEYLDTRKKADLLDKIELLLNLIKITNPDDYEENIQVLEEHRKKKLLLERKKDEEF